MISFWWKYYMVWYSSNHRIHLMKLWIPTPQYKSYWTFVRIILQNSLQLYSFGEEKSQPDLIQFFPRSKVSITQMVLVSKMKWINLILKIMEFGMRKLLDGLNKYINLMLIKKKKIKDITFSFFSFSFLFSSWEKIDLKNFWRIKKSFIFYWANTKNKWFQFAICSIKNIGKLRNR